MVLQFYSGHYSCNQIEDVPLKVVAGDAVVFSFPKLFLSATDFEVHGSFPNYLDFSSNEFIHE